MAKKKSRSPRKRQPVPPAAAWMSAWSNQSEVRQHAIILVLLVVISLGFFAPVHFTSKQLIGGDTVHWSGMANSMISHEQETGEKALWAPNAFGGMPGFMVSYPLDVPQLDAITKLLRGWIWPSSHMILLLLGTYLLVWYLSANKFSGLFAAIAFGFTTYLPVILMAGHNSKFVALAWVPWLLVSFAYVLKTPSIRASLLFAIFVALNLRAGHIQITYYAVFVAGIWWLMDGIRALRGNESKRFVHSTAWLALGALLALLMVAQPYLVQWEYKQFSIRGLAAGAASGGMSWEYAMAWSQGIGELFTLLVADAYGGSGGMYWGPKTFTGGPHYFGALTIGLAVVAVVRRKDVVTRALAVSALVMILFSLGENMSILNRPMFDYFPLFDSFRVPETWLSIVALTVAILAGLGISAILDGSETEPVQRVATITLASAAGVLAILFLAPNAAFDFEKPVERAQLFQQVQAQYPGITESDPRVQQLLSQELTRRKEGRVDRFKADSARSVVFLIVGVLILFLLSKKKIPGWLAGFAFAVLILLDLTGVGRRYINQDMVSDAKDASEEVPKYAFDEFLLERVEASGGPGHLRVLSLEFGQDPAVNSRPSFHYESLGGYHGAKLRLYQDYLDQILFNPSSFALNPNALTMMNVRYVVGRRAVPGFEMVFQDDATGNSVFENPDAISRAFFVSESVAAESSEQAWQFLQSPDFDVSQSVILDQADIRPSSPIDSTSIAYATLVSHSPNEIIWDVETDADRWLVVSEIFYPAGWTATLDDAEVPIVRGDYLLRAVYVPEGSHTLRMSFTPQSHYLGVWITGLASFVVYGGLVVLLIPVFLRRRRLPD